MSKEISQRNTKQKKAIMDCLESLNGDHFTIDGLCNELQKRGDCVGRATVYRAISLFVEQGFVKRYCLHDEAATCFQFIGSGSECLQHFHLMCDRCGRVFHFQSELLHNTLNDIADEKNFSIDERHTVFYGICEDCKVAI